MNEAVRRMLALENLVRRAASGMPLEIDYLAPVQTPVQPAATQSSQVWILRIRYIPALVADIALMTVR